MDEKYMSKDEGVLPTIYKKLIKIWLNSSTIQEDLYKKF